MRMDYSERTLKLMGRNLSRIIRQRGVTIEDLSLDSGVSPQTIYRMQYHLQKKGGGVGMWLDICEALGCTLIDLLSDERA